MPLKEFDKKFDIAVKNFNSNVLNLENIQKRVDEYSDENGKMDLYSVVGYLIMAGWDDEGIGWVAPSYSNSPVYRVYNPNANGGDHYYTKSKYEAQFLVNKGWKWDGNAKPVFYSGGKLSVYVAYNPNAQSGAHNYTSNSFEQQSLLNIGWKFGSTAWNAVTKFNWNLAQYRALIVGDSEGNGGVNYNDVVASHDIPSDISTYESGSYASKYVTYDTSACGWSNYQSINLTFVRQPNGDYLLAYKSYYNL